MLVFCRNANLNIDLFYPKKKTIETWKWNEAMVFANFVHNRSFWKSFLLVLLIQAHA